MKNITFIFLVSIAVFIPTISCSKTTNKNNLKILFITNFFPYSTRSYLNNQIKKFIDKGHDVWIYSQIKCDSAMTDCLKQYDLEKKIQYGSEPHGKFDVILCQFGFLAPWVSSLIKKKKLHGKFIIFLRGEDISSHVKQNPHMYDQLFLDADLFLPVCNHFRQRLISLGCDTEKVTVLHSAILYDQFHYMPHAPNKNEHINILSVAQISERKGLEYSIEAITQLHKTYPKIHYTIVGGGEGGKVVIIKKLKNLVQKLNAESFIHFTGKQPHHTIPSILDTADIFVLPCVTTPSGLEEGIPNALMEAMICGLPVVSTYHAGIPELIQDGVTGYLAPQKNVSELVKKITLLIENQDLCIKMGKKAHEYIEKEHNMNIEIEKLEQLLYNLVS